MGVKPQRTLLALVARCSPGLGARCPYRAATLAASATAANTGQARSIEVARSMGAYLSERS
jgi:hypothetical protein